MKRQAPALLLLAALLAVVGHSAAAVPARPNLVLNLAADPKHIAKLTALRDDLAAWMKSQGDQQKHFAEPRLLSDPSSFGPKAGIGD